MVEMTGDFPGQRAYCKVERFLSLAKDVSTLINAVTSTNVKAY